MDTKLNLIKIRCMFMVQKTKITFPLLLFSNMELITERYNNQYSLCRYTMPLVNGYVSHISQEHTKTVCKHCFDELGDNSYTNAWGKVLMLPEDYVRF